MKVVKLIDMQKEQVSEITLPASLFSAEIREDLMLEVVRWLRARHRSGTACVKNRSDVAASTKKIYRQKGTGNARHGAKSAPIFRGGGVVFGPHPRSYEFKLNKKVRRKALLSALSLKAVTESVVIFNNFAADKISTSELKRKLEKFDIKGGLVVDTAFEPKFKSSISNLYKYKTLNNAGINVYDLLKYDTLLLSCAALKQLEEKFNA